MVSRALTLLCVAATVHVQCVYLYSSFYAPLGNPRILGYRVDARFDPEAGARARHAYERRYGPRGRTLLEHLGDGRGPPHVPTDDKVYGDVKFLYTYPGAYNTLQ